MNNLTRNRLTSAAERDAKTQAVSDIVRIIRDSEELFKGEESMSHLINKVIQVKPVPSSDWYDGQFASAVDAISDGVIYIEDKSSLLGMKAIQVEAEWYHDGALKDIIVVASEDDDIEEGATYDSMEELFGLKDIRWAIYKPYAARGEFITWEDYKNIIDGYSDKKIGEL